jgi:hypothetical protein
VAKYDPLFDYLCRAGTGPVEMTFAEIADLVGPLPASAATHQAWWANESESGHVQARAWLNAGREVERVDQSTGRVWFSAPGWRRGS